MSGIVELLMYAVIGIAVLIVCGIVAAALPEKVVEKLIRLLEK